MTGMRLVPGITLLALALGPGCSSDSPEPPDADEGPIFDGGGLTGDRVRSDSPVQPDVAPPDRLPATPIAMAPAAAAETLCAKVASCCSAEQRAASDLPQDLPGCQRVLAQAHMTELEVVERSIAMGRAAFDGVVFAECMSALKGTTCTDARATAALSASLVCPGMIVPKVVRGGSCRQSFECIGGYCQMGSGGDAGAGDGGIREGRCTGPRKSNFAACTDSIECESGNCDPFDGLCQPAESERLCE
jgi:hypothetical protein